MFDSYSIIVLGGDKRAIASHVRSLCAGKTKIRSCGALGGARLPNGKDSSVAGQDAQEDTLTASA